MQPDEIEFMQWGMKLDADRRDAEIEEMLATPRRAGRPETDWDMNEQHLPRNNKRS